MGIDERASSKGAVWTVLRFSVRGMIKGTSPCFPSSCPNSQSQGGYTVMLGKLTQAFCKALGGIRAMHSHGHNGSVKLTEVKCFR